jgi:hypothetical protein
MGQKGQDRSISSFVAALPTPRSSKMERQLAAGSGPAFCAWHSIRKTNNENPRNAESLALLHGNRA